ncbi:MAG: hypothetical protein C4519_06190 [Desulfobacteraceae bacterium]|nr:MAG: hypothetical protein C4519_06190 [Desulfobacteraceae bacterium]
MDRSKISISYPRLIVLGFIAGFLATVTFHQLVLGGLWLAGIAPSGPYAMTPRPPLGIPAVISLAFWGGVWGSLFALIQVAFPRRGNYWWTAFLFGAIIPSLVVFFVVLPLRGLPIGGGWQPPLLITAFLINGVWGVGTGLILRLLAGIPHCGINCGLPVGMEPT